MFDRIQTVKKFKEGQKIYTAFIFEGRFYFETGIVARKNKENFHTVFVKGWENYIWLDDTEAFKSKREALGQARKNLLRLARGME